MSQLEMFRDLIPEFSGVPDDKILRYLERSDAKVAKRLSEIIRDEAVVYLAAHQLDLANKRFGSAGQVASVTEGKLNIQYVHSAKLNSDYDYSNYGRRYKDLVNSSTVSVVTFVGY